MSGERFVIGFQVERKRTLETLRSAPLYRRISLAIRSLGICPRLTCNAKRADEGPCLGAPMLLKRCLPGITSSRERTKDHVSEHSDTPRVVWF